MMLVKYTFNAAEVNAAIVLYLKEHYQVERHQVQTVELLPTCPSYYAVAEVDPHARQPSNPKD